MFRLSTLGVAKRLCLLIGFAVFGIVLLVGIFVNSERRMLMDERQNAVRQTVEAALQRNRVLLGERYAARCCHAPDQARTHWQGHV